MGLFFKKKEFIIYAPIEGDIKQIESLKDKTFATKVMGDGIAIEPKIGKIYSPINGTINTVLDAKHAYGLTSDDGFEILIHIGQDTVNLKGEGFVSTVKEGDVVKVGDLLGTFDINEIKSKGYELTTPVILLKSELFNIKEKTTTSSVKVGDVLLKLSR